MTDAITGEITQWSEISRTKFGNLRRAFLINETWFGIFDKQSSVLEGYTRKFPAGSKVYVEYIKKGDFYNMDSMRPVVEDEQNQLDDEYFPKKLAKTESIRVATKKGAGFKTAEKLLEQQETKEDQIKKAVALKAATEFYANRSFLNETDAQDVADNITSLADKLLKWLS